MVRFLPLSALCLAFIGLANPVRSVQLPPTSSLGLQISLVTGISHFDIPTDTTALTRADLRRAPFLVTGSFAASVSLTNFSRSQVTLTYPSVDAPVGGFRFTLIDSLGHEVWESDPLPGGTPDESIRTLAPRATLRRTVQVSLKTPSGAWLPGGRYTLRAEAGKGEAIAALPIEITAPPSPDATGIQGQVFFRPLPRVLSPPFHVIPLPTDGGVFSTTDTLGLEIEPPVPSIATVTISEIREPNARYDHPPFTWTGSTDDQGRFHVVTPAGRFSLFASIDGVVTPESFAPASLIVTVTKGAFTTQNITVPGYRLTPGTLVYHVDRAVLENVASIPGSVRITAIGSATTPGWTNTQLVARPRTAVGVLDLDFVATSPSGIVAQVITPIVAQKILSDLDPHTTVKIHSNTNTATAVVGPP